jgi:hypothetical protein
MDRNPLGWERVVLGSVVLCVAFRKTEHRVVTQLLPVCGLTLTAPAAWYTGTGRLGVQALFLWNSTCCA